MPGNLEPAHSEDDDEQRALAIAHVFVDFFSSASPDLTTEAAGDQTQLVFGRLQELGAVGVTTSDELAAMDITPLLSGAALAMSNLLDLLTAATGWAKDEAVIRWRDQLG